jgi:hypothetical protein
MHQVGSGAYPFDVPEDPSPYDIPSDLGRLFAKTSDYLNTISAAASVVGYVGPALFNSVLGAAVGGYIHPDPNTNKNL